MNHNWILPSKSCYDYFLHNEWCCAVYLVSFSMIIHACGLITIFEILNPYRWAWIWTFSDASLIFHAQMIEWVIVYKLLGSENTESFPKICDCLWRAIWKLFSKMKKCVPVSAADHSSEKIDCLWLRPGVCMLTNTMYNVLCTKQLLLIYNFTYGDQIVEI